MSMRPFEKPLKPAKTSKARRFSRFGAVKSFSKPPGRPRTAAKMVDEFGLAYELYRNVSPLGRRYIAHALETLGYSKLISPSQQSPATIPELVVYGGLLLRGFRDFSGPDGGGRGAGPKGFVFRQVHGSRLLGRIAEVDFTLYLGLSVTAVMVDGAFHSADHPAGLGGAAMVKDRRQWQGLLALLDITRVLSVNRYLELESGPEALVSYEFSRMLGGSS